MIKREKIQPPGIHVRMVDGPSWRAALPPAVRRLGTRGCNDRPHSPASVECKLLRMRPTCSIVHAFGINWSKTESTTIRTESHETTGALNGSADPICLHLFGRRGLRLGAQRPGRPLDRIEAGAVVPQDLTALLVR
jgi:hypothetical protein